MPRRRHPDPFSPSLSPQTARTVGFAGTVEPRYKSDLGFRVLGRIISRDVNVGDVVKKGQRLATLDPLAYQLAVRSAQADLASATARLENAAATETRQRTLLQQNIATQAQFDAAEAARESAEAGVTSARANLDKAEEQLGYTELRADFDGVVTATEAELGQVVQPGRRSSRWLARTSARRWSTCPRASGGISGRSPLRHRPAAGSLGAGCRVGAGDRTAGGSRHPHAAGEDHPRQPAGEFPSRNDDHRHGHDAGCPGHRAAGLGPAGAGRQDDGLGRRSGHPDGVDPGRDDCRRDGSSVRFWTGSRPARAWSPPACTA